MDDNEGDADIILNVSTDMTPRKRKQGQYQCHKQNGLPPLIEYTTQLKRDRSL